jgi:hypothetical protein
VDYASNPINGASVCPIESVVCNLVTTTVGAPGFDAVSPAPTTAAYQVPGLARTARPADLALQHDYSFTIKIVAKGGFVFNSEPIMFIAGCTPSINITDAAGFEVTVPLQNQQNPDNLYRMVAPAIDRAYCVPILYEATNIIDDGRASTTSVTLGTCPTITPCTSFSLARTYPPRIITFQVLTTITNNI